MRLIITRSYGKPPPKQLTHLSYKFNALLELTNEEKELVAKYKLGSHVLAESKYLTTTVDDLIRGNLELTNSLHITMGNERALRNACAALPEMFDYCRSFGKKIVVEYSSDVPASPVVS